MPDYDQYILFVPKPFTPFQWASMLDPGDYLGRAKIVNDHVKEQLNHKSIRYNWHEADVTVLEGVLARGDRRLSSVIHYVYEHGGIFDAWSDFLIMIYGLRHSVNVILILIFTPNVYAVKMKFSHGILLM